MKIFYQPGSEKGIIRWSLLFSLLFLGLIIQFEIFKNNFIAPIIVIISIFLIIWFIWKSYLIVDQNKIIFHIPFRKQPKITKLSEIKSVTQGKYYLLITFKSSEFFPIRLISMPKNITKLASVINK